MVVAPMRLIAFVILSTSFQFIVPGAGVSALNVVPSFPEPPSLNEAFDAGDEPDNLFEKIGDAIVTAFSGLGAIGTFLFSLLIYPFQLIPFIVRVLILDFVPGMPSWVQFPLGAINFIGVGVFISSLLFRALEGGGSITPFT